MAKDSNKSRVLQRRKQELDHAIKNAYPLAAVQLRAEKLRAAVIAVLKKHGGPFPMVNGTRGNIAWTTMRELWETLSISEIIELSSRWGPHPTFHDIQIDGDGSPQDERNGELGVAPDPIPSAD